MQLSRCWIQFKVFGSKEARAKLVRQYGHLVKSTIDRLSPQRLPEATYEDMVGAGVIGLIRAIDQYDPGRDTQFESYAVVMIRIALLDYLRADDWFPRHARDRIRNLQRAQTRLEAALGRRPEANELASELGLPEEEVNELVALQHRCQIASLDESITPEDDGVTYVDVIPDDREDPRIAAEGLALRNELAKYLQNLSERERTVLAMYYHEELTFAEIGRELGVSESRAHQLHGQAMQRLRVRFARTSDAPILR